MGAPVVGSVVLVAFPYADFSRVKKRPALVVGTAEFGNAILCQITSQKLTSKRAVPVSDNDFLDGGLRISSFARPGKLFTVEPSVVQGVAGTISAAKLDEVKAAIRKLFT